MPQTFSEYIELGIQYFSPAFLFLVALLGAVGLFTLYYLKVVPAPSRRLPDGDILPPPRLSFCAPKGRMTRRDSLICLLITVVYAVTAFFHLGSFSAPQNPLDLKETGAVEIALPETVYLTSFQYYYSLGTGSYNVEVSNDGNHWSTLWTKKDDSGKVVDYYWANAEGYSPSYAMAQGYNDLFKWHSISCDNPQNVNYIRITPKAQRDTLQLTELVLYSDRDGTGEIPANRVDLTGFAQALAQAGDPTAALFDELHAVPEEASWYDEAYFDEIYHPRTALEHIENRQIYETTHPPLGKLLMSIGIRLFGMTPFGWRFIGTLFGVLMLPIFYVFLKKLFGRSLIAICGTILFATDFMHLTQTRIATIDTYAVFFIVAAYFFLYLWLSLPATATFKQGVLPLFFSGLMFGIGAASKWTVFYAGAGMALLYLFNMIFRWRSRKEEGVPAYWPWFWKNVLVSVFFFVIIPVCIYTLSYWPYAVYRGDTSLSGLIKVMWDNQSHMLNYHQGVTEVHPYQSKWWMWMLDARPILYYMVNTATTSTRFAAFLNPLVCYGGLIALVLVVRSLWQKRDAKALFILVGFLSQLVPWIPIARPTFNYHYFPSVPFLILALCYLFNELARRRPAHWQKWVLGLTAGSVGLYIAFYPVLIGLTIPTWYSTLLRWLPSWPF